MVMFVYFEISAADMTKQKIPQIGFTVTLFVVETKPIQLL